MLQQSLPFVISKNRNRNISSEYNIIFDLYTRTFLQFWLTGMYLYIHFGGIFPSNLRIKEYLYMIEVLLNLRWRNVDILVSFILSLKSYRQKKKHFQPRPNFNIHV